MDDNKIWTAAELERLPQDKRAAILRSGFSTDLSKVSPESLARARHKADLWIAANEGPQAS
ncbi:MAG: hypothetical protein R2754_00220 [Microthrixaceae bacterium]